MISIRTPREFHKQRNSSGFSLIEVMVVVAIMGMIALVLLPSMTSYFQVSINAAAREIATSVKEGYNASVLTGKVYRMAYDLKENTYWVEYGPREVLLDTTESKEKEARRKKFRKTEPEKDNGDFQLAKTITRKKVSLPRGVVYEDIFTQREKDPVTKGMAYTHFFPNGLSEQTVIHLQDRSKHHVSLVISPLVGVTDLYLRYMQPKEVFPENGN